MIQIQTSTNTTPVTTAFSSFDLLSSENIPALGVNIAEYRHRKTDASHNGR
jgi:hypothetical protein